MPGIQKKIVSIIFKISAPKRPVEKTANGGNMKQRKYRITMVL
jgi:hypothetical protein